MPARLGTPSGARHATHPSHGRADKLAADANSVEQHSEAAAGVGRLVLLCEDPRAEGQRVGLRVARDTRVCGGGWWRPWRGGSRRGSRLDAPGCHPSTGAGLAAAQAQCRAEPHRCAGARRNPRRRPAPASDRPLSSPPSWRARRRGHEVSRLWTHRGGPSKLSLTRWGRQARCGGGEHPMRAGRPARPAGRARRAALESPASASSGGLPRPSFRRALFTLNKLAADRSSSRNSPPTGPLQETRRPRSTPAGRHVCCRDPPR